MCVWAVCVVVVEVLLLVVCSFAYLAVPWGQWLGMRVVGLALSWGKWLGFFPLHLVPFHSHAPAPALSPCLFAAG